MHGIRQFTNCFLTKAIYFPLTISFIILSPTIAIYLSGLDFPPDFLTTVKSIFRQLFRLFVHIYHYHYTQVLCLNEEGHLNSLFAHFIAFSREFDLLDKKDLVPLQDLINNMESNNVFSAQFGSLQKIVIVVIDISVGVEDYVTFCLGIYK